MMHTYIHTNILYCKEKKDEDIKDLNAEVYSA